ncbi:MAG: AsmA-like C-terminal domain-containing protein [Burkholderiales bacterium]|nr:AsmA-like C-terminal domain-containing protein [Phycisphaerae bacterium]
MNLAVTAQSDSDPADLQSAEPQVGAAGAALTPDEPVIRRSRLRTIITLLLLVFLVLLISGYVYVTDSERVRSISERYLTDLSGGRVYVGRATLSIFEGLRLDDIRIDAHDTPRGESRLFEARSLQINYSPRALLFGKIEATRILAMEPHAYVVENMDDGLWNFQRLRSPTSAAMSATQSDGLDGSMLLPQVLLRSARIDYAQIHHRRKTDVGTLTMEGQLTPDPQNLYRFRLQSRGGTSGVFPIAEGWLTPGGDQLGVVLRDVEFVDEIKTILPAVVRKFWEDHSLAGRIGETRISYFRKDDGKAGFKVETDLDGVRLVIPPSKWMDDQEKVRIDRWKRAYTRLSLPVLGSSGVARLISGAMMPGPLQLDEVDGTFVFTEDLIHVESLVGRIENNRFKFSGDAHGYAPAAPFKMRVQSLNSENIFIPDSPRYISSMPWPVQEIYYRFRPRGACSFWLDVSRTAAGGRPKMDGELQVHDAAFTFDRFPYPIEHANGSLRFGNDPVTGEEMLEIVSIRGRGYTGGKNENATIEFSGKISPLDKTAGTELLVSGRGLVSEPKLIESMPPQTRKTVKSFDPGKTGLLPTFSGDFDCVIKVPIGIDVPWTITTTIDIRKASGMFAAFPLPLKDLNAKLVVYDDYIDLQRATMARGTGQVEMSGKIDWTRRDKVTGEPLVQPDLKLIAKAVPLDDQIIAALPEQKRKWLKKVQLSGDIDLDGRIHCPDPETDETTLNAALQVRRGALRLAGGQVELTDLQADARISPTALTLTSASARHGDATIEANAAFDLTGDEPDGSVSSRVRGLKIDQKLIAALPEKTRTAITSLQPEGTVDLDIDYSGASPDGMRLVLRPRELSFKPVAFPLKLTKARGEVVADARGVVLKDFVVQADAALLRASGYIDPKTGRTDLAIAGRELKVTDELRKALPPVVQRMFQSVDLKGTIAFDLTRLAVQPAAGNSQPVTDVEFVGTMWLQNASMDAGVPMTDVNGVLKIAGAARDGAVREIAGDISFDSLKLAGRDVAKLTANIAKQADKDVLQLTRIDGRIADGQISGQIDSILSEKDPRFGLALVLRNAKVAELTGDTDKPIDGRLDASLSLEGKWADPTSARGSGDVKVAGKNMYRVPIVFGLMQMANLSLPLESPIRQAGLRYNVEGQRVILETIDLRSATSAMEGSGWIDFGTKQVQMTLYVVNEAADSVPIFGQLIKGAREDFMQIRVRGTIQDPKVGAGAFNTITTTVDEVLKGRD